MQSFNKGGIVARFPSVCKDCVPPKRHVNCHADCKDYLTAKAEHEAELRAVHRARAAERDAEGATFRLRRK